MRRAIIKNLDKKQLYACIKPNSLIISKSLNFTLHL